MILSELWPKTNNTNSFFLYYPPGEPCKSVDSQQLYSEFFNSLIIIQLNGCKLQPKKKKMNHSFYNEIFKNVIYWTVWYVVLQSSHDLSYPLLKWIQAT